MNRLLLFFYLLLFLPGWLAAQAYEPMVVEGAHWRYGTYDMVGVPYAEIYDFVLRGDTVVNNIVYKKLYWRILEAVALSYSPPYQSIFAPNRAVVGLREDTISKRVYAVYFMPAGSFRDNPCPGTTEATLFDFSYQTGDTIDLCRYRIFPLDTMAFDTVVSIYDTIFFEKQRRVIHTAFDVLFVEGVGGGRIGEIRPEKLNSEFISPILIDLAFPNNIGNIANIFLDHHCVGSDANCEIITSVDEMHAFGIRVDISPQPASSQLQIRIKAPPAYRPDQIRLLNQQGQVVLAQPINEVEFSLEVEHLPAGLYFLEVRSGDRSLGSQKTMIVQ